MTVDEEDDISSYGSGHSSEGVQEITTMAVPTSSHDDLATVFSGIAALARGQAIVLEKLTFLEKIVGTVQFDMTWVRDDMKSVHQAMDRFADYVCDVQDEAADRQRLKEQASLDGSLQQSLKGKEHAVEFPQPPSASTSLGEQQYGRDVVADRHVWSKEVVNVIQETQTFAKNREMCNTTLALTETGRREWVYEGDASPELGSPPYQQTRATIEKEPPVEESQQIEMSCQSTQPPTPGAGRSMWEDYTSAVRDWQAPDVHVTKREEGWVSAKKGRWELALYGQDNGDTARTHMLGEHGAINLNLLPEKQGPAEPRGVGVEASASTAITGASRSTGNGKWRGNAPARRPPAAQPRYHTSVRIDDKIYQRGCCCMLSR